MEAHAFLNPLHHSKQLCKSELQSKCRASCHVHFTSAAPALRGQWTVGPLGKFKIIMVPQSVAKWGPLGTKLGAVGPLSISSYVCQIMDSAHRTVGPLSRPLTSKSVAAVPSKACDFLTTAIAIHCAGSVTPFLYTISISILDQQQHCQLPGRFSCTHAKQYRETWIFILGKLLAAYSW